MTTVAPVYELFFAPLEYDLDPNEMERIHFAYMASKYGHANQVRDGGERYFDHPKAAAWIYISELGGRDPRIIIDLLLHDISEDQYLLSAFRLRLNFGNDVARDVRALTKLPKKKETTVEYLGRVIAQGPWTILAKLCDRLHNLRTLGTCTREKIQKTVAETREYHLPLLINALHEHGAPWSEYATILEKKITEAINALT